MPGFGVSFNSTASALSAIQEAIDAVQNNVVNANTPGYAAERANFQAQPFDPKYGLTGGVDVSFTSSRDQYLEQAVRRENSALGTLEQANPLLSNLQSAFSASGDSGVPGALSSLASSFAALSGSPNSVSARADVIQAASTLAQAFNQTAAQISQVGADATQQALSTVTQINGLTSHIASLNAAIQSGAQNDAGVAADLNSSLDSLSELVNISVNNNADGSATVLLDGQSPLVLGSQAFALTVAPTPGNQYAPYPSGDPGIRLMDHNNVDITAQATQGKLGALLQVRNQAVRQYLGDQNQPGDLNNLAQTFADRVNDILAGGQISAGPPPVNGSRLFVNTSTAAGLAISSTITPDQIAAGDGTTGNAIAVELANITNPTNQQDLMGNGQSFTAFYSQIAGEAGAVASQTASDLTTQQSLTAQVQNQRQQASGVSLDAQAAQLLALQQAYQATARVISILSTLSQTAVNLIPQN